MRSQTLEVQIAKADKKAKRRMKSAKITHITLCGKGKNNMEVMLKSDGAFSIQMLSKAVGDELHAIVWLPEEAGPSAIDQEGDVAPAKVVKQFAHDFISNMVKENGGIDVDHDGQVLGADQVRLAETFIVQKGDPRFTGWKDNDGNVVDPTGAWAVVIKLLDPTLVSLAASGDLGGVSMFGRAMVEVLKAELPAPPVTSTDPLNMNEEQMTKLAEMIAKAMKPATAATPPAQASATIAFEGDILNPEDIQRHADKVLFASLDMSKSADVLKWGQHVAKRQAEVKKAAEGVDPNAAEIAKLQAQIAKLQGASGAGVAAPATPPVQAPVNGMVEQEAVCAKAGKSLAQRFQGRKATA